MMVRLRYRKHVSNYIGFQKIVVVSKTPDGVAERRTIPVQFVPMVGAPP